MGFYTVLYRVNKLLELRGWRMHHCRRCESGDLRYFVTDEAGTVLAPRSGSDRSGLTLVQLLQWLAQQEDAELVAFAAAQQADPALAA